MTNYKNLLDILKRNGCKGIVLHESDLTPFLKYAKKRNCNNKIKISIISNELVISPKKNG